MQNLVEEIARVLGAMGRSPRERLEREYRERVDVGGWLARRLSDETLRRDIRERPRNLVFGGDLGEVAGGRGAQIDQLDPVILGDQDVRRLDVAMDDAVLVGVVEG
jgi:hypothetical protein